MSGGLAGDYSDFIRAVAIIRGANLEPDGIILGPDTAEDLELLVDTTHQPLRPPASYADLGKFITTKAAGAAYVGQWPQLLVGMRQQLAIEASRTANDENGLGFSSCSVLIRATLRADIAVLKPSAFVVLTGWLQGS